MRCQQNLFRSFFLAIALSFAGASAAQHLDVEIIERADGDFDTCALGQVSGLKADGDGFLAVRSGPGSGFAQIGELRNGDRVWLYDANDGWHGIVFDVEEVTCDPITQDRPVETDGKKGWVFGKWIELLAG